MILVLFVENLHSLLVKIEDYFTLISIDSMHLKLFIILSLIPVSVHGRICFKKNSSHGFANYIFKFQLINGLISCEKVAELHILIL